MENFFEHLEREANKIDEILDEEIECRPLTKKEMKKQKEMSECPFCEREFTIKNPLVKHHDHISKEFLDFVCQRCNLQLKPHRVMAPKGI